MIVSRVRVGHQLHFNMCLLVDHTNGDDYAGPLLGILIMQDVHLGFLIAILPALAGHHGTRSARVIKSGLIHDMLHGIRHSGIVFQHH